MRGGCSHHGTIPASWRISIWVKKRIIFVFVWIAVVIMTLGSLSKHDVDESENVIWKSDAFLQPFFQLFKLLMLEKCVLTILELNWNQRLRHKKTKLNICHSMLTSSTQLQNRSFHVVERTRTSTKCQKMKIARAKCAKILFFIVKYANLWGFYCRRRRGCLSSLLFLYSFQRISNIK